MAKLLQVAALVAAFAVPAAGQQVRAGDSDDQIVITGCVMKANYRNYEGPRSLIVWSKGDVYLESATPQIKPSETANAVGTAGTNAPVFYWIDDEDDFGKHAGNQVEIVGELNDELNKGEVEVESRGAFTEIEFNVNGKENKVRVPSQWLSPDTPAKDADFDVVVRTIDVEKVTVMGPCRR